MNRLYKISEAEAKIYEVCKNLFKHTEDVKTFIPDPRFGHMAINAPIIYSKSEKNDIQSIYELMYSRLLALDFVDSTELVKGFCNIRFKSDFLISGISDILELKSDYGSKTLEKKIKVNIEYISANPTGDLHVGHIRGIYGDVLSRCLSFLGYDVTREYYINNVGNQIYVLGRSVYYEYAKIRELVFPKPDELYPGESIKEIAKEISAATLADYSWDKEEDRQYFMNIAVDRMLERIKSELKILNIEFDRWRYESEVHAGGYVDEAISLLESSGCITEEILSEVKSKRGKASNEPVKVFRNKDKIYEEDQNPKAITKSDGSYTYFAADIGYHLLKIKEGYDWIIDSFGADHHLHAETLSEVVPLLSKNVRLTMMIFQVVKFKKNGDEMKLSKRGGITLKPSEILEHLPDPNILRFVMASKQQDTQFLIDIDSISKISMENAFYSVQYAHARSCSLLRNAGKIFKNLNLSRVVHTHYTQSMIELAHMLIQWPKELELVEQNLNINNIANYLQRIAKKFNSIWSEKGTRWILQEDESITGSRLALALAFKYTISSALAILGIEAYDELNHEQNTEHSTNTDFSK